MKVYTKTGDKGQTSLIGGYRVSKGDARLEAYGSVDELMAYIGLIYDMTDDTSLKQVLFSVMDRLMVCSSLLACDDISGFKNKLPFIHTEDIAFLEHQIDDISSKLPPIKAFTFPCGHKLVSTINVARTICRRAERNIVRLSEIAEVESVVLEYINRLSDFLYVLTRKLINDFSISELVWLPK